MSNVFATEVADGVTVFEVLADFVEVLDETFVERVELCLVETLLVLVVLPCEVVEGVLLTVPTTARQATRRGEGTFMFANCCDWERWGLR